MKNEELVRAIFSSQTKYCDLDSCKLILLGAHIVVFHFSFLLS
jgi:hypothetical protein